MPLPAPRQGRAFWAAPVFLTILDGVWAFQALASSPRHPGSNVAMVSLAVWVVLHLPAAVLVGLLLRWVPGSAAVLPPWSRLSLALLGLVQTFALALGLARRFGKRA